MNSFSDDLTGHVHGDGLFLPDTDDFLVRVDRLLDGPVDETLEAQILAEVTHDHDKRKQFAERLFLSGLMSNTLRDVQLRDDDALAELLLKPQVTRTSVPAWLFSGVSLIALLAMFAVTYQGGLRLLGPNGSPQTSFERAVVESVTPPEPLLASPVDESVLAELTNTGHCQWGSNAQPTTIGTRLKPGTLELASGVAELTFTSGARLTLEGPVRLELISAMRCRLSSGAISAHVPEQAQGFTIESPGGEVIDFGTEFGIRVEKDRTHVQVFEGEVEVASAQLSSSERLLKGHAATLSPTQIQVERDASAEFPPTSDMAPPEDAGRRLRLSSSQGRGAAEYVFSPGSINNTSDTLLLVKHEKALPWRRIAYLRFDVSSLTDTLSGASSASLTLSFLPSGFGFASRMPDCDFTVFGVTNQEADNWSASTLNWENAPALMGRSEIDPAQVTPLAWFTIKKDETAGVRVLETPELIEFLKRDNNGVVTLIITRDTPGRNFQSPVHAFSGNRHPTVAPPSLEIVWPKAKAD